MVCAPARLGHLRQVTFLVLVGERGRQWIPVVPGPVRGGVLPCIAFQALTPAAAGGTPARFPRGGPGVQATVSWLPNGR